MHSVFRGFESKKQHDSKEVLSAPCFLSVLQEMKIEGSEGSSAVNQHEIKRGIKKRKKEHNKGISGRSIVLESQMIKRKDNARWEGVYSVPASKERRGVH